MIKLIVFDMDGVIYEHSNVWLELHKAYGVFEEGAALTKKYLYTDYDMLVQTVVAELWKGRDAQVFIDLVNNVQYNPGVQDTIAQLHKNYTLAIISSGPKLLVERAKRELAIDDGYANDLVIEDGKIAGVARYADGSSAWPIRGDNKAPFVKELCKKHNCSLEEVAFVGDDMADAKAFEIVGLPLAFNDAPEELIEIAKRRGGTHIPGNDLSKILSYF